MSGTEKKILIVLMFIFILLPFAVARNLGEIFSRVSLLWINYVLFAWYWAYAGEPIWRTLLACYGISSVGVILIYLGVDLLQEIDNFKEKIIKDITSTSRPSSFVSYLSWLWLFLKALGIFSVFIIIYWPRRMLNLLKKCFLWLADKIGLAGFLKQNNHQGRLVKILSKGSIWIILLVFVIPVPVIGLAAIAAMRIRRIKYGLWYLLAANIFEILLVVYLSYSGINWSFSDWFSKF